MITAILAAAAEAFGETSGDPRKWNGEMDISDSRCAETSKLKEAYVRNRLGDDRGMGGNDGWAQMGVHMYT